MKTTRGRNLRTAGRVGGLALMLALFNSAQAQPSADPGWPRVFKKDKKQLTVYQPQVDYWYGYTNLHFRCAIAVKGVMKQEQTVFNSLSEARTRYSGAQSISEKAAAATAVEGAFGRLLGEVK